MYSKRSVVTGITLAVIITTCVGCASKDLSGTWSTNFVALHLTQSGSAISGTYDYEGGTLEGTIVGDRLDYTWNQTNGKKGRGYFIISDDWKSIAGRYGYNDDDSGAGEWKGTKE